MKTMVVGASRGLGRALIEGLGKPGDTLVGVSRSQPKGLELSPGISLEWIEADLAEPLAAVEQIAAQAPEKLDVLIYNMGFVSGH